MAEYLGKWPSKRGPISKIRPSDGCGRDAAPLAVERWYDFPEFGGYLGNVGWALLFDLNKAAKERVEAAGRTIPFPQRDVHMIAAAQAGESAA